MVGTEDREHKDKSKGPGEAFLIVCIWEGSDEDRDRNGEAEERGGQLITQYLYSQA